MTKEEALQALRALDTSDPEEAHTFADGILLALIGDPEITKAWGDIPKWFA